MTASARKGSEKSFTDVILRRTVQRPLADDAGMRTKSSVKAIRNEIDEARRERRTCRRWSSSSGNPERPGDSGGGEHRRTRSARRADDLRLV